MWNDLPHPTVIAHRGDKTCAPENTLAAFILAADKGADAIEFDVQLTADEQVVLMHDPTVDRTTNGTGKVSSYNLTALRDLDAGVWFSKEFKGERVPTLDEVFEILGKRLHMNIELKNYTTPNDNLVSRVAEVVKKHQMQDRTLFSSFLTHNLRKAATLLPEVPRGILTMAGWLGYWGRTYAWRGNYSALHPKIINVDSALVERVHDSGKRINVWTVDTEEELKEMVGLGVDAVITGDLDLVIHALGRR
jgi:glycerophosphoryl diester phosphodiesterase